MAKRDMNFIKHTRHQVKVHETHMKETKRSNAVRVSKMLFETRVVDAEAQQKEICKTAAKMSPKERLGMFFADHFNGTWLGSGCNWDIATRMGWNRRIL